MLTNGNRFLDILRKVPLDVAEELFAHAATEGLGLPEDGDERSILWESVKDVMYQRREAPEEKIKRLKAKGTSSQRTARGL